MKLNKFNSTILKFGHCYIEFKKELTEEQDRYDINLLLIYFKQKKHKKEILQINRSNNPVTIKGILFRNRKNWAKFMEWINLDGIGWYNRKRDFSIKSIDDGLIILDMLAEANRIAVKQMKKNIAI